MKRIFSMVVLIACAAAALPARAQDSAVARAALEGRFTFTVDGKGFKGAGWDTLLRRIRSSDFVLLGEDHFTNEIPFFTAAVTSGVRFDNFFGEIDPYSARLLGAKIKMLSPGELEKFWTGFADMIAFYGKAPEARLLQQLVRSGTAFYGLDQVLMNADRLLCSELKKKTAGAEARKIYAAIEYKSKTAFAAFLKDPAHNPMYLMTDDFDRQVAKLKKLRPGRTEEEQLDAMVRSAKIYREQDHHLRIQLMKQNLMDRYPFWRTGKSLFKFGSNHMYKGESFLKIYDLGNLVNNIADAQYKSSLHILLLARSGRQASPFRGFPPVSVDESDATHAALKPLLAGSAPQAWTCFDMRPLRAAKERGSLAIRNITLARVIEGFDYVVIIPEVTPAPFAGSQ